MKKNKKDKDFLHKPVFRGGMKAMRKLLKKELRYPEAARKKGIEGTVHLRYAINHLGEVIDATVVSGLGSGCDEEAVRLVKLLKFEVSKNRKIKVLFHKTIQIHFRLPKVKKKPESPKASPELTYQYVPKKEDQPEKKTGDEGGGFSYTVEW